MGFHDCCEGPASQLCQSHIIVSLINDAQIIERILRLVGSGGIDRWVNEICNHGVRIAPSTGPPATETIACGQLVIELCLDDPMPDYDCGL